MNIEQKIDKLETQISDIKNQINEIRVLASKLDPIVKIGQFSPKNTQGTVYPITIDRMPVFKLKSISRTFGCGRYPIHFVNRYYIVYEGYVLDLNICQFDSNKVHFSVNLAGEILYNQHIEKYKSITKEDLINMGATRVYESDIPSIRKEKDSY